MTDNNQLKELATHIIELAPDQSVKKFRRSDELKLLAVSLYSAGYTTRKIADACHVSQASVSDWINNPKYNDSIEALEEVSDHIKETLSRKMYLQANHVMSSISESDVEKASLSQKGIFTAVMIDKARLLDGQSTENVSMLYKRQEKLKSKKDGIDEEIKALEAKIAIAEEVKIAEEEWLGQSSDYTG